MRRPPAVASALMRALLPAAAYEPVAGDLDEAWHAGTLSRARYWRLALASIASLAAARLARGPGGERPRTGDGGMRTLMQDLVYGARLMRRNPVFTAAAVITLALGIGANTAIFGMVHALLIEPLDFRDPKNVAFVRAWLHETGTLRFNLSTREAIALRRQAPALEDVAAYQYRSANLTGGDRPERVQAYRVTANLFDLLGVPPLHGRTFVESEGRPGGGDAAVLSHGLWRRRFAADPSVVGRDVQVDGRRITIVGVMPPEFEFPVFNFKGELWMPLPLDEDAIVSGRAPSSSATVVARVRAGVGYEAAQAQVDAVMRRLEDQHPETNRGRGARLAEIGSVDDEIAGPAMMVVMLAVGVVLILACANVANLLLARGVARGREIAVRAALGAGRARIVRQLLAESLLLSLVGGAAGAAVAYVALNALRTALPEVVQTTQPNLDALGLNPVTLGFTLAVSVAAAVVFGLVPACRAAGPSTQAGLREGAGAGGSRATRRLRSALVIGEVTLATALLILGGLFVRTYQQHQRIDPGFDAHRVLTLAISLPEDRYATPESRAQFFETAAARVASLGGIESAGFVNVLPFSTYNRAGGFTIEGQPAEPGREPVAGFRSATTGYFTAMRIPLRAGRAFEARDGARGAPVAIVNEAFVRAHVAGRDPLGARIRLGGARSPAAGRTIVGVVGDVRHEALTAGAEPEIYVPMAQSPTPMMMLAARTAGDPEGYAAAVRTEIQEIDPAQPVFHVKSAETLVGESLFLQIAAAAMMSLFSALALALAAVGVYGVIAYGVSQQRREFGVRLALGARPRDILRLVLRGGLRLVAAGILAGAALAFVASRLIGGLLYGVGPGDPATYTLVAVLLGLVGAAACGIPAWRAGRTEPVSVLRE